MAEAATLDPPSTDTAASKAAAAGAAPAAPAAPKKPDINPVWRPLAKPDAEAEKRQDEAAAKIFGNDDEEPSGETEDDEAATEGETAEATDDEGGETEGKAGEPEGKQAEGVKDSADYAKAMNALRRDGYDTKEIDELAENPERLIALGLRAAKRQAETDRLGAELAELKKQTGKDSGQADRSEPEPAAQLDLSAVSEPFAKLLSEEAGLESEAAQKVLGDYSSALTTAIFGHVEKQIGPLLSRLQQGQEILGKALIDTDPETGNIRGGLLLNEARRTLSAKRRPELSDDATFDAAVANMNLLRQDNYGGDFETWLDDAARMYLGGEPRAHEQARKARIAKHKANGTPESGAAPTRNATTDIPSRFRHMDVDELALALVEEQNAGKITRDERMAIIARAKAGRDRAGKG